MKKQFSYRPIVAALLAALVFQVVVLKEAHHFFDHHHHQPKAHCTTYGPETHLHSEEYAPVDCQICFFSLAPATFDPALFVAANDPVFRSADFFCHPAFFHIYSNWHFHRRGPPRLPA